MTDGSKLLCVLFSPLILHFRSSYHVLIPRLVFLNDFEQVRSIGSNLRQDWRQLLANCFPKIMVNILPHFALPGHDPEAAKQREKAHHVYDLLKDDQCLGKQVWTRTPLNLSNIPVLPSFTNKKQKKGGTSELLGKWCHLYKIKLGSKLVEYLGRWWTLG